MMRSRGRDREKKPLSFVRLFIFQLLFLSVSLSCFFSVSLKICPHNHF